MEPPYKVLVVTMWFINLKSPVKIYPRKLLTSPGRSSRDPLVQPPYGGTGNLPIPNPSRSGELDIFIP